MCRYRIDENTILEDLNQITVYKGKGYSYICKLYRKYIKTKNKVSISIVEGEPIRINLNTDVGTIFNIVATGLETLNNIEDESLKQFEKQ